MSTTSPSTNKQGRYILVRAQLAGVPAGRGASRSRRLAFPLLAIVAVGLWIYAVRERLAEAGLRSFISRPLATSAEPREIVGAWRSLGDVQAGHGALPEDQALAGHETKDLLERFRWWRGPAPAVPAPRPRPVAPPSVQAPPAKSERVMPVPLSLPPLPPPPAKAATPAPAVVAVPNPPPKPAAPMQPVPVVAAEPPRPEAKAVAPPAPPAAGPAKRITPALAARPAKERPRNVRRADPPAPKANAAASGEPSWAGRGSQAP